MKLSDPKATADTVKSLKALKPQLDEAGRELVDKTAALLSAAHEENRQLENALRWHAGAPYRSKQESVAPGQLAFDLIAALKQGETPRPSSNEAPETAPKRKPTKRKRRGRELEVRVEDKTLTDEERMCDGCDKMRVDIGVDIVRRFVYVPAQVYLLEEHVHKYACRRREEHGVVAAEATPKPIPGGMASCSMLAHILVSKLFDGLPIERVAKQFQRHGADLATSTLNDWFGECGRMFVSLQTLLLAELRRSALVSLDDTPLPARNKGHPRGIQKGRLWIYLGDVDRIAYCEFSKDWKGTHPQTVLKDYSGRVQNDGYAGINPLFTKDRGPTRSGCNDHGRRKFVQALERGDNRAQPAIDVYRALYKVEAQATEQNMTAEDRLALRQAQSVPLWAQLGDVIDELAVRVEKKSPIGKAITYWRRQNDPLSAFLRDGVLPISNAHVERQIRAVSTFRKNSLFVGTLDAGERYATLMTLAVNCILRDVNPYDYFVDVIGKIAAGWPAARGSELLPGAWLAAQKKQEAAGNTDLAVL